MRIVTLRFISTFKLHYVLFGLIALGTLCLALFVSRLDGPIGLGSVRHSAVFPGDCAFDFTNNTSRKISYRVASPQFKCNGLWQEFREPAEFIWIGPGKPLLKTTHETLAAGASRTIDVARPMAITAPVNATTWRVVVLWSYTSPTRLEQLSDQALEFLGRNPRAGGFTYTNFSPEVAF